MTYNFEFIKSIPELSIYYNACEQIEKVLAKEIYDECYCSIKRLIEKITYETCISFNIELETDTRDNFSISAQWNNPKWMNFIGEKTLIKDIKTFIKNRNSLEHSRKTKIFIPDSINTLDALQWLQDFFIVLYCKYTNIDYNYQTIMMPIDEDQIEINDLKDQLQQAFDDIDEMKNQEPIVEIRYEYIDKNNTLEYGIREEL